MTGNELIAALQVLTQQQLQQQVQIGFGDDQPVLDVDFYDGTADGEPSCIILEDGS